MTSLGLPNSRLELSTERIYDAASLRAWLADRWAILFSHPEDFAQEQLETDRWVSILSRSFGTSRVASVALARNGSDPAQGWLGHLAALDRGWAAVLRLEPPLSGVPADLCGGALRVHIARSGSRFATIIDPSLRCRRTLSYGLPAELPSPFDLIGWAVALRKRDHASGRQCEPESALPIRSAWSANARYGVARAGIP